MQNLALWGRSMGAATAMLYLGKTLDIKAVIFDSPYKHLKGVLEQILKNNSNVPSLLIGGAVKVLSKTIEEKTGFDPNNVNPLKYNAPGIHIPALFLYPDDD